MKKKRKFPGSEVVSDWSKQQFYSDWRKIRFDLPWIATLAVLKQPMFIVNILSLALVFPQNWSLFPRIDTHILI